MLEPVKTIQLYQRPPSPQVFAAGEVIFSEGDRGLVMYGIISGEVEIWFKGKVVEIIKQGDVFGERALVHEEHKRASTAIAKTQSQLAFLDRAHFLFAIEQTPMFALIVMRSYSDRLCRLKHLLCE